MFLAFKYVIFIFITNSRSKGVRNELFVRFYYIVLLCAAIFLLYKGMKFRLAFTIPAYERLTNVLSRQQTLSFLF